MTTELRWLGHGSWLITSADQRIVLDPFLTNSPTAPLSIDELEADYILVSHGHFDHVDDLVPLASRCQATVIAMFEITNWLESKHEITATEPMNLGGEIELPFGRVKMVQATHSSVLPDGTSGGVPAGFVVSFPEGKVYFACDTGLFLDMQLIGKLGIELAVLPIGDRFTMGPADSIEAIKLLQPRRVAPAHYNTWPPIEQDAVAWAEAVKLETAAEPVVLEPGQSILME
jgi:L-ascorbate metabolism protein UlaG (beta-lactamase superfamily)